MNTGRGGAPRHKARGHVSPRATERRERGGVRGVDSVRVGPQGYPTVSVGQRCFVLSSASLSRDLCMSVSFLHLVVCPRGFCGTDSVTWAVGCFPLLGGSVLGFLGASTWTGQGFRAIGRALCAMLANMFSSHPPYAPLFSRCVCPVVGLTGVVPLCGGAAHAWSFFAV